MPHETLTSFLSDLSKPANAENKPKNIISPKAVAFGRTGFSTWGEGCFGVTGRHFTQGKIDDLG